MDQVISTNFKIIIGGNSMNKGLNKNFRSGIVSYIRTVRKDSKNGNILCCRKTAEGKESIVSRRLKDLYGEKCRIIKDLEKQEEEEIREIRERIEGMKSIILKGREN